MVKLEAKDTIFVGIFYFHNVKDCREFMDVFKDHWCNVPWKEPIEIPDDTYISSEERRYMDKSPKKRAEDNLSWGFSLERRLGICLTNEQNDFVKSIVNRFS